MAMFKTILTALDLSEMSRDILHYAVRLAESSPGARLLIVHVVADPLREPWSVEAVGVDFEKLQADWMAAARRHLDDLIRAERLSTEVEPIVIAGRPADAIVETARQHAVDILVIGTHGYGPVKRFMLGSVADSLLRQAECPVLAVPHKSLRSLATEPEQTAAAAM